MHTVKGAVATTVIVTVTGHTTTTTTTSTTSAATNHTFVMIRKRLKLCLLRNGCRDIRLLRRLRSLLCYYVFAVMIRITVAVVTVTVIRLRLRVRLRLRTVIQLRMLSRVWPLFYGCCCDKACSYVYRYTGTITVKVMVIAMLYQVTVRGMVTITGIRLLLRVRP